MIELIDGFDALAALAPEWSALCERSPGATVFQTPQWLLPWWKHLGGGDICSLAMRRNNRLCGLAPLFRYRGQRRNLRQISFIGAGISDYLDFIAEPEAACEFVAGVRQALDRAAAEWDILNLEELRPEALALAMGDAAPCSVCPVVRLPSSVEGYEASLDKTHRRNLRHARKYGNFTYEVRRDAFCAPDFIRLHEMQWRARGREGVVNTPALRAFYAEAAQQLASSGALRIHLLRHDDEVAGAILGFQYKGRGYAYLGGFDPALKALSPGAVLMWHAIAGAIEEHIGEWDLLRGSEQYKYLWNATNLPNHKINCNHPLS